MDTRTALQTVLDQVDYTAGNCGLTEMVGAVLPKEVIALARDAIQQEPESPNKNIPYKQVLDFQTLCERCGKETILITSENPQLPTFHFCGCRAPTFELIQDGVGKVPSFAQADFGDKGKVKLTFKAPKSVDVPAAMDSTGKDIYIGSRVRFRGQIYTIKEFLPGQGTAGTARIIFNEPQHVEEPADEISVDLLDV